MGLHNISGGGLEEDLKHPDTIEKLIGSKEVLELKLHCDDKGKQ